MARGEKIPATSTGKGTVGWTLLSVAFLVVTLALAALLRTWHLDLVEFKQDESSWLWLAADLLDYGKLPLIGSVDLTTTNTLGMHIPPLMAYVMAVPLLISRDPVWATGFVALLNVGGVGLLYWFARRYFGQLEANLAALFLAASPVATLSSRKIWSNYILAPFTILLFLAVYALFVEKKKWALAPSVFLVFWCLQLHPSSAPLAVCLLLLAVAFRRELSWRPALTGLLTGLVLWLPYLYFVWQTRGDEVSRALAFFTNVKSTIDTDALSRAMELITTEHTEVGASIDAPWWMPKYGSYFWMDYLWLGLLALGFAVLAWSWIRPGDIRGERRSLSILLVWAVVPIALDLRHSIEVQRFYLLPIQPALFLIMAVATATLIRFLWPRVLPSLGLSCQARLGFAAVLGILSLSILGSVISQSYASIEFLRWAERGNAIKAFGYPPLRYELEVARQVSVLLPSQNPVIFVPTDKDTPKVFAYLLRDHQPDFQAFTIKDTPSLPLDRGEGAYLIPYTHRTVLDRIQTILPAASWSTVSSSGGEPLFALLPSGKSRLAEVLRTQRMKTSAAELKMGLKLVGWQTLPVEKNSRTLVGLLLFQVTGQPTPPGDYHLFNHLIDSMGNKVAQQDSPSIPIADWRRGERWLMVFTLELPKETKPGEYRWLVGAYDLKTMQRSLVHDVEAGTTTDAVSLGPLTLP